MSETLRSFLHRMADEVADFVSQRDAPAPAAKPPRKKTTRTHPIVAPPDREMTPEQRERAEFYARRAGIGR